MDFQGKLAKKVQDFEDILGNYLPQGSLYIQKITDAMNYSLLAGGKRIRPLFMKETYQFFGGEEKVIEPFMVALEMIHTYSLVHDDLPCMDNDEYRRGRKTTHIVYGEGMALLAGDGLLNLAYETALTSFSLIDSKEMMDYQRIAKALIIFAQKAGIQGMIGGQTADIEAEEKEESMEEELLLFIHKNKTAALIEAAMTIGAILAGAKEEDVKRMEKCAYNIGLAFQIQDDILDVIGTKEELGKPIGSDAKNHKQTYVGLKGLEAAKKDVESLSKEAMETIDKCDGVNSGEFLKEIIASLIHRSK